MLPAFGFLAGALGKHHEGLAKGFPSGARRAADACGCATRPVNPPITQVDPQRGYTFQARQKYFSAALQVPNTDVYAIDVSFPGLKDKKEFDYLNQQPTSFVLPAEAVDRLRAAAGTIILDSPEFKRLLNDVGATLVTAPAAGGGTASGASR